MNVKDCIIIFFTLILSLEGRERLKKNIDDGIAWGTLQDVGGSNSFYIGKYSTLSLFPLTPSGHIKLPTYVKRVWIDVGANARSFSDTCGVCVRSFFPNRSSLRDEFLSAPKDLQVIAIDANSFFYDSLSKLKNVVAIPCVLSFVDGFVTFYHYAGDGCSSTLPPNRLAKNNDGIPKACKDVVRIERICSMTLETILKKIPPNISVELLKVDAQGTDLEVVQSAGTELFRIEKVILEAQEDRKNDTSHIISLNSDTVSDAKKWLSSRGFKENKNLSYLENGAVLEWNLVFDRVF